MSDPVGIAGDRIRSFVERIEQLDTELQEINEQRKEVFAEAKGEGFDVKVLKEIIRLRKQDQDERDEHETLLYVYMRAMDTASPRRPWPKRRRLRPEPKPRRLRLAASRQHAKAADFSGFGLPFVPALSVP